jgi:hypothetical protein
VVHLGLALEGGDDRRINLGAGARFHRSFGLLRGTTRRPDPDLRASGIFDSNLYFSRQFPPILLACGGTDGLFAVAGTEGETQKENKA